MHATCARTTFKQNDYLVPRFRPSVEICASEKKLIHHEHRTPKARWHSSRPRNTSTHRCSVISAWIRCRVDLAGASSPSHFSSSSMRSCSAADGDDATSAEGHVGTARTCCSCSGSGGCCFVGEGGGEAIGMKEGGAGVREGSGKFRGEILHVSAQTNQQNDFGIWVLITKGTFHITCTCCLCRSCCEAASFVVWSACTASTSRLEWERGSTNFAQCRVSLHDKPGNSCAAEVRRS